MMRCSGSINASSAPNNSCCGMDVDFIQIALDADINSGITTRFCRSGQRAPIVETSERRPALWEPRSWPRFRDITIDVRALATVSS